MANVCALCGKRYQKATRRIKIRSKYNPTRPYRQKPNLQWLTLANGKRVKACASCIKSYLKKKVQK